MDNQPAPTFTLLDQFGAPFSLEQAQGNWVVLYFYPKDNTPLCTQEACGFRDQYTALQQLSNVQVVGVSQDSVESHHAFAQTHNLPFTLLSDTDLTVTKEYDCYQPPETQNREYLGIIRSTFIIDPDGKIAKVYKNITPDGHSEMIVADLKVLSR